MLTLYKYASIDGWMFGFRRINSSTPIANYRARQSVMEKYAKPEK